MEAVLNRRELIFGGIALGFFDSAAVAKSGAVGQLQSMERRLSPRVVVYVENLQTSRVFQHRPDEQFAMCSAFKASLAELYLRQADQGQLDRIETFNSNISGGERSRPGPKAIAENLRQLTISTKQLTKLSQELLIRCIRNEQNGKNRIKVAVPDDWIVANKPGGSLNGAANDISVLWSPNGVPFISTVLIDTQRGRTRAAAASVRVVAELKLTIEQPHLTGLS